VLTVEPMRKVGGRGWLGIGFFKEQPIFAHVDVKVKIT